MSLRRFVIFLLSIVTVMTLGLALGVAVARAGYLDVTTCEEYLSTSRADRIHRSREFFRELLNKPHYIRVQLECAQNPSHLRRFEESIERMCHGRDNYLVRNAWLSAYEAHKAACNWR